MQSIFVVGVPECTGPRAHLGPAGSSRDRLVSRSPMEAASSPPTERSEFALAERLHNEGEYYEAHEAWESIWTDEVNDEWRLFVQGLIQVTSAFHKLFVQ